MFEPVRKTQEATYFRLIKGKDGKMLYEACSPAYAGPKEETTLEKLAKEGKASLVGRRERYLVFCVLLIPLLLVAVFS